MEIMKLRVHRSTALEQYLASGAADDVLNTDDKKEVEKLSAKASNAQSERASYARSILAAGTKLRQARVSEAAGGKKRRKVATAIPERLHAMKLDGSTTAAEISHLLPAGYRCWHDQGNSRWQLYSGQRRVRNASFTAYGVAGAAQQIISAAWNLHQAFGGEPMPFGLGQGGVGQSGSSSSGLRPPDAEAVA